MIARALEGVARPPVGTRPLVLVGMSGGVDSSVSAALLQRVGWNVAGGFIKNWSDSKDGWTGECAWRGERRDAMRVAAALGIPLLTFDFEASYRDKVVETLFRGYGAGETPNPDVLCNEAIKFGLFMDAARKMGAAFVATGHYARVVHGDGPSALLRGIDPDKDQSYFLYRVSQSALKQALFPIGHLRKPEVREIAAALDLPVAQKPDSQGICFIGKLDMQDFLRTRLPSVPGDVVGPDGNVLGRHTGLDGYTIGQRQGIALGGGPAWYVARKDIASNRLVVVPSADHSLLFASKAMLDDLHWTAGAAPALPCRVEVQVRYRQAPVAATMETGEGGAVRLAFDVPVKAVAPGQSAVLYQGKRCLGGGVILEGVV